MVFSYNLSTNLKNHITRIDELRAQIVLTPIPSKIELRLRFEAVIDRVYYALRLGESTLSKEQIRRLLERQFRGFHQKERKLSRGEQEVMRYKRSLDYISEHWLVSSAKVSVKTVEELYERACGTKLRVSEEELRKLLEYLGQSAEHPIVQAGLVYEQFFQMVRTSQGRRVASLLSLLYCYRQGYDVRGLLVIDEPFVRDTALFNKHFEQAATGGNLTLWLEYFAQALSTHLEGVNLRVRSAIHAIKTYREEYLSSSLFTLNERQRGILTALAGEEGATITNRKVQKLFGISQITASRDLAKLATLGLLFAHGKGRSVYYTRV